MKSEDILPKNRRLNRMQLTVLENGIIRHPPSALGNVPTLVEYHNALEAAEEAEGILRKALQRIENQALSMSFIHMSKRDLSENVLRMKRLVLQICEENLHEK